MRYALALDLVGDPQKIAAYEQAHQKIWPAVRDHLLSMLMEVDPSVYSAERMASAALSNPAIVQWEALMGSYQLPTPWAAAGDKWTPMHRIFSLRLQAP